MKIAMLYASWEKFGEPWGTPHGVRAELESRGHEVKHYNLYHDDGEFLPGKKLRSYSNQGINLLYQDFHNETFRADVIFCMDYGPWDALQFDKKFFPGAILVSEAGDEPQSHAAHCPKAPRVDIILSPDWQCTQRYREFRHNAIWWTHHADHRLFRAMPEVDVVYDCVTTCGGREVTGQIQAALGEAFNNERYFFGEDHVTRLNMGKMVFQCSQHKEVTRRIFEGMACGKMVITDRLPAEKRLQDLFKDGIDIVYYDNAQDAIDKIKYYAKNDKEREVIAANGKNKVLTAHTVAHRVDEMEDAINDLIGQTS